MWLFDSPCSRSAFPWCFVPCATVLSTSLHAALFPVPFFRSGVAWIGCRGCFPASSKDSFSFTESFLVLFVFTIFSLKYRESLISQYEFGFTTGPGSLTSVCSGVGGKGMGVCSTSTSMGYPVTCTLGISTSIWIWSGEWACSCCAPPSSSVSELVGELVGV